MTVRAAASYDPAHLRGIDALRGFAAVSVLLFHVIVVGGWDAFPHAGPFAWFRAGWLGVDVFFAISGLVVTLAALRERDRAPHGARARFFLRRAFRILPLYYLTLVAWLVFVDVAAVTGPDAWLQVVSHALLFHNTLPATAGSINGPSWSIGTEVQLYVLVALVAFRFATWRVAAIALAVGAVAIAYRYGAYALATRELGAPSDALRSHLATQAIGMVDAFGLGMALAVLVARRGVPAVSARAWWALLGAAVLVASLVASGSLALEGRYWTSPLPATLFRTATAAMGLLLVAVAVTIPPGVMRRVPRVFSYLGEISYGIYLWHMPVLVVLLRTTELRGGALALATFAGTIALAAATWHAMEKPLIGIGRRLTRVAGNGPAHELGRRLES